MSRSSFTSRVVFPICLLLLSLGADRAGKPDSHEHAIHLPGIAGAMRLDRYFIQGLREGGYAGTIDIYNWTGTDPGLASLFARKRNEQEAAKVATAIERIVKDDPKAKIRLICHSGGAGIAAWALERLPENVHVETLVFIAPALSQHYDLSKALARVRGKAYALNSVNDGIVLGAGTRTFGTIDGVREEAAGMRGFTKPDKPADEKQYEKLVQIPYDDAWMTAYDNIGAMGRLFAREYVSQLVQGNGPPATQPAATTRPTTPARSR